MHRVERDGQHQYRGESGARDLRSPALPRSQAAPAANPGQPPRAAGGPRPQRLPAPPARMSRPAPPPLQAPRAEGGQTQPTSQNSKRGSLFGSLSPKKLNERMSEKRRQRLERKAAKSIQEANAEKAKIRQDLAKQGRDYLAYQQKNMRLEQWQIDALDGARVYKLEDYTTTDRVRSKYAMGRQQQLMLKTLVTLLTVLVIITVIAIVNPIRDFSELKRILGLQQQVGQETSVQPGEETVPKTTTVTGASSNTTESTVSGGNP